MYGIISICSGSIRLRCECLRGKGAMEGYIGDIPYNERRLITIGLDSQRMHR